MKLDKGLIGDALAEEVNIWRTTQHIELKAVTYPAFQKADDTDAFAAARAIAKRVEEEMTFPGEIKVTVLREVRAEATAK